MLVWHKDFDAVPLENGEHLRNPQEVAGGLESGAINTVDFIKRISKRWNGLHVL